jgi:hypothetical protein
LAVKASRRARTGALVAACAFVVIAVYALGLYPALVSRGRPIPTPELLVASGKAAVGVLCLFGLLTARRLTRPTVAVALVVAIASYLDFGVLNGWPRYVHTWDVFHYYVGAKYSPELGYTELYRCSVIAEAESSPLHGNTLVSRKIRDLSNGGVELVDTVLESPERCKERFSPERWRAFRDDVAFFRSRCDPQLWSIMLMDHGYQPPPAWTMVGRAITSVVPASDAGLRFLASLDLALLCAGAFLLYWAFGPRVALVALVFMGVQWPANTFFMGGAFLRQDWLFAAIASVCFAARRRYAAAGGAVAVGTLLRLVPIFLVASWVLLVVRDVVRRRRAALRSHARFAAGLLVVGALFGGLSAASVGPHSYAEFYQSITLHARTPLIEQMGLQTVLSYTSEGRASRTRDIFLRDQYQHWRAGRNEALERRHTLFLVCVAGATALVAAALGRVKGIWIALAFGVVLATVVANVAGYYYSVFILLAPLSRRSIFYGGVLVATATASAALICIPALSRFWDERYLAQSIVFLVCALTFCIARIVASTRARRRDLKG